jgi:ribosome-associated toxin RatA of RatAB toxin-antitoxin module
MAHLHRSARVRHTAAQMFELVDDIESYPQFLHWCRDARIERRDGDVIEASLDIGVRGIHKSFVTRNVLDRPRRIGIELVSGPFRRLEGEWRFTDLEGGGSEVSLSLQFEIAASPFNMMFSLVFEELVRSQIAAFVSRAETLYG